MLLNVFKKAVTQKLFLHIYYIQNIFDLETAYTSGSKLLSIFVSKHPKKLLLRIVSFSQAK